MKHCVVCNYHQPTKFRNEWDWEGRKTCRNTIKFKVTGKIYNCPVCLAKHYQKLSLRDRCVLLFEEAVIIQHGYRFRKVMSQAFYATLFLIVGFISIGSVLYFLLAVCLNRDIPPKELFPQFIEVEESIVWKT